LACGPDRRSFSWSIGSGALKASEMNSAVEVVQLAERVGVALGEARERRARPVEVLVDHDAGAVAERRTLLHQRFDVGKSVAMQLEIADQRRMAKPHEEIGVQVEPVTGKRRLLGRGAAADARVALEHDDLEAGAREVRGKRQPVVSRADDDAVVFRHLLPPPASVCFADFVILRCPREARASKDALPSRRPSRAALRAASSG
jgi:hypothetical protein